MSFDASDQLGAGAVAARLAAEGFVSLDEVPRMLGRAASGRRISRAAVFRWALKGMRARDGTLVRLEVTNVGRGLVTSRRAVGGALRRRRRADA